MIEEKYGKFSTWESFFFFFDENVLQNCFVILEVGVLLKRGNDFLKSLFYDYFVSQSCHLATLLGHMKPKLDFSDG